jgi:hypothetical protein
MMADESRPETFQLTLPRELLAAASRQPKPKTEQLRVEGWRTSWLTRVSEVFVGKD